MASTPLNIEIAVLNDFNPNIERTRLLMNPSTSNTLAEADVFLKKMIRFLYIPLSYMMYIFFTVFCPINCFHK